MLCRNIFPSDDFFLPCGGCTPELNLPDDDVIVNLEKEIMKKNKLSTQEVAEYHSKLLCDNDCNKPNTKNLLFDTLNNFTPSSPMSEAEVVEQLGGNPSLNIEKFSKIFGIIVIEKTRKTNIIYDINDIFKYQISKGGLSKELKKSTSIVKELDMSDESNVNISVMGESPYTILDKFNTDYRILSLKRKKSLKIICPHIEKYNKVLFSFLETKNYEKSKISRTYESIIKSKLLDYFMESFKDVRKMSTLQGILRRLKFYKEFVDIVISSLIKNESIEVLMTLEYEKEHIVFAYSGSIKRGMEFYRDKLNNIFEKSNQPQMKVVKVFEEILDKNMDLILSTKLLSPVIAKLNLGII